MPVWHNATRKWRESGELAVVGITQEQHPARCRLFAQWQGIKWPILWDPMNLTGSNVVPNFILIDEHGIVRSSRARTDTVAAEFIQKDFVAPDREPYPSDEAVRSAPRLAECDGSSNPDPDEAYFTAISDLLWGRAGNMTVALAAMRRSDPAGRFRLGVAHRMRYDSEHRQAADFQSAIEAWTSALGKDPNQYIWRRRIQQYGPRLDKPYPFYDWVKGAQDAIRARGDAPVELDVGLTESETAGHGATRVAETAEPDPEQAIEAGPDPVHVEASIAPGTGKGQTTVRIHLVLRPNADAHVAWDLEAGTPRVWIAGHLLEPRNAATIARDGGVRFEVEVDRKTVGALLAGYALYYACLSESGACRYLRHDFDVALER